MGIIKARTAIAAGGNSGDIVTTNFSNIAIFCSEGKVAVEVFLDSAAADGYHFVLYQGAPKVIVTASKITVKGLAVSSKYEIYAT